MQEMNAWVGALPGMGALAGTGNLEERRGASRARRGALRSLVVVMLLMLPIPSGMVGAAQEPGSPASPQLVLRCPDPCRFAITPGTEAREREPMLALDPSDPRHMVLTVQEPPTAVAYVTGDLGATWTRATLPPDMGAGAAHDISDGQFVGDPVALVLRSGTVLYAGLGGDLNITEVDGATLRVIAGPHLDVARSEDGGLTFPTFVRVATGNGFTTLLTAGGAPIVGPGVDWQDKPWLTQGLDGTVLMAWSHHLQTGATELLWSASRDDGETWSQPSIINPAEAGGGWGAFPVIGSDGTWYVSYVASLPGSTEPERAVCCLRLILSTSRDEGVAWEHRVVQPAVFFNQMPQLALHATPDGDRLLLGYMRWVEEDLVGAAINLLSVGIPVLASSDDGGATWSELELDQAAGHRGYLHLAQTVAVDGTTYVSFYHHTAEDRMDRRLVAVRDGAIVADLTLDRDLRGPAESPDEFGEYFGLVALPDGAFNAWINEHNGNRDLYGARVAWVQNAPPIAAGTESAEETDRLTPVQFTDHSTDSDGRIVAWNWDFGDGTTSSEQHPSHTYAMLGRFTPVLTVTDNDGASASLALAPIAIANLPPAAAGRASADEADRLTPVQFTDQSTDRDGAIVAWLWDFGDDTTSSEQHTSHTYAQLGTFRVQLTATDNDGGTDTAEIARIKVKNIPPSAARTHMTEANRIEPLPFQDQSSDPDGQVVGWHWDFGDGAASTEPSPSHQYATLGTYAVTLRVTDNDGDTSQARSEVTVVNLLPIVGFRTNPTAPKAWTLTHFLDETSDPDGTIAAWHWDFGDGGDGAAPNVTHRYLEGGLRAVRLVATDNDAGAVALTQLVYVCQPGVQHDASAEPDHLHVEVNGCVDVGGDDVDELLATQMPDPADPGSYLGIDLPLASD